MLPSPALTPRNTNRNTQASSTRTYDSKLVSREMHRLGTLAHLPSLALAPSAIALAAPPSNLALNMAPAGHALAHAHAHAHNAPNVSTALAGDNPWASLHVLVLPLFNNEALRCPM